VDAFLQTSETAHVVKTGLLGMLYSEFIGSARHKS